MRIVGVIDLMGGVVVRGVAGRREEYRPVESLLCASAEPPAVARAFVERLGLRDLYLADLDAIAGAEPAWAAYGALAGLGARLWVDAGVRDPAHGRRLGQQGVDVVAGLETVSGPAVVE